MSLKCYLISKKINMKKLALILIALLFPTLVSAWYKLEKWSIDLVNKYSFNSYNLDKEITRKEFVETLYDWYKDYKKDRWVVVNYERYKKFDNSKYFTDVDLESDFGKKLSYFSYIWAFAKNPIFNPNWAVSQKDYFTIMKRLRIMFGINNCKFHRICEREADENSIFNKGVYYKYTSKILDRNLRKYYNNPQDYINKGYKPYLSPYYNFPLLSQTLNWCYAFAIRNILKYKYWIGVYVSKVEREIKKPPTQLWTDTRGGNMSKYDKVVHITKNRYYTLDNFITSLQSGEPVMISYMLEYTNRKWKKVKIGHVVAAYSFDEKWVWISETVAWRRLRVKWDDVFNSYWNVKYWRIFKIKYNDKSTWTEKEIVNEQKNNFITREF